MINRHTAGVINLGEGTWWYGPWEDFLGMGLIWSLMQTLRTYLCSRPDSL